MRKRLIIIALGAVIVALEPVSSEATKTAGSPCPATRPGTDEDQGEGPDHGHNRWRSGASGSRSL